MCWPMGVGEEPIPRPALYEAGGGDITGGLGAVGADAGAGDGLGRFVFS